RSGRHRNSLVVAHLEHLCSVTLTHLDHGEGAPVQTVAAVTEHHVVFCGTGGHPMPVLYVIGNLLNQSVMFCTAARTRKLASNEWHFRWSEIQVAAETRNVRLHVC